MQDAQQSSSPSVGVTFGTKPSTTVLLVQPCKRTDCDCDICLRQRIATVTLLERLMADLAELEGEL